MSRAFWRRLRRQDDAGVSFAWPRDTDLTREQIEIAMRESAASPSQPDAGRTVVTTALDAPRPQTVRLLVGVPAEAVEALMMDPPPGVVSMTPYDDLSAEEQAEWREAYHAPPPQEWQPGPTPVFGPGPSMPMRSLSNDNYDRVWIAQGDHVEAMGVGDTPQEAAIEYARAVADLLRPTSGPDALDSKAAIRQQLAACRGDCGEGRAAAT